jgi:Putative DNA-binding domain
MAINSERVRQQLKAFEFKPLFNDLGWDNLATELVKQVGGVDYRFYGVAEKRGVVVLVSDSIPDYAVRVKLDKLIAKDHFEHLIVFADKEHDRQVWQWFRKEPGKPVAIRTYPWSPTHAEFLLQKLEGLVFTLDEEEVLTLTSVTGRLKAFDVEKVTKKFYELFKTEHANFLSFIKGIPDKQMESWYASVMVNRLMFLYFIQEKGFLNEDRDYLRNKLKESRDRKPDAYYTDFLCPLFFQGFARKKAERTAAVNRLLGEIPYLNGGLFQPHQIEELYGKQIVIADKAFEKLFNFFKEYDWHLDERENRNDREINPDVLGYIFEKYINQKQMGAYYTKEDITEYIAQNTIIPFLLDETRKGCAVAFTPEGSVWRLLQDDPDRYIHDAMKKGADFALPAEIEAGVADVGQRTGWNRRAPEEFAHPTEIWREVIDRLQRYHAIKDKLIAGEVHQVNDLVTLNLNIRQFAQDVIQLCEGPELLRAVWKAIEKVSVLDPTCGSGAFLFAALNILKPLYEACLIRMQGFIEDNDTVRPKTPEETIPELIKLGESSTLEFKSIARWNLKESKADKTMEQIIVKTVAAFLNSQGGDLLIGVQDDGKVLGIAADQQLWKQDMQNRDTYENWLTTLLLDACGKQHTANLKISFARINDNDVCRVTILPSAAPVYIKEGNLETLYVRTGNSTRALTVKEAVAYHQQRFTNFHPLPAGPEKSQTSKKYTDFRKIIEESKRHPKQDYFILKAIIVNNLFGVDIMEEAVEICKLRLFLKLVAQVESQDRIEPLPDIDFNIRAGNTLVGYARLKDIRAGQGDLYAQEMISQIEDKARVLDSAVELFRKQQTELDGTVTADDKINLRRRFSELEAELNDHLSGEYGIKKSGLKKWKESHKPFHWFCDFHRILASGGFDVIIGNPPWKEYAEVKESYQLHGYATESCGNLHGMTTERAINLAGDQGRISLIVQLPLTSSSRMNTVRSMLRVSSEFISVIPFDDRPGKLFDGLEHCRSVVFTCKKHENGRKSEVVSRYQRWPSEARPFLFSTISFVPNPSEESSSKHFPKTGSAEASKVIERLMASTNAALGIFLSSQPTDDFIFYQEATQYWVKATVGLPFYSKNGHVGAPAHGRYLYLRDSTNSHALSAVLNSSLFYLYFIAFGDCFHLSGSLVSNFGIPSSVLADPRLTDLSKELMADLKRNSVTKTITTRDKKTKTVKDTISYAEFDARSSKSIIDKIDSVLAEHYSFTAAELDMILNFDVKFRLGCAAKLAAIPTSESLAGGTCPVATVVISGGGFR